MYLKSLEMQGFKSFPDRTKLMFDNGAEVSDEMQAFFCVRCSKIWKSEK